MRLFLIDGHALVFKMYYAFLGRPMVNSRGEDTSILYGFTKYLLELINKEHPTHIAVSFDPPGGTFRNELYPAYKANRGETPVPVIQAVSPSRRHCPPMARMQSMVASMSWLWAMPRMRLSPDASAAHSSMRCPQLFDGGAAAVPAALPG